MARRKSKNGRRRRRSWLDILWRNPVEWVSEQLESLWFNPLRATSKLLKSIWTSLEYGTTSVLDFLWHALVLWPLRVVSAGFAAWRESAQFRYLLGGLPALLLMIGVLILAVLVRKPIDRAPTYYLAALQTLSNEQYDTSRIYHDRLLEIQGPRDETLFNLMLISEHLGDRERQALLMERLAPLDKMVHGPAHLRKAQTLMGNISGPDDVGTLTRLETHLLHASRAMPNSPQVHGELGKFYMMTARPEQAIEHLEPVIRQLPGQLLMLAQAYALTGNQEAARKYGTMSQTHFRQRSQTEPTNRNLRIKWAQATSFLEDFPEAIEILQRGIIAPEDEAVYRKPIVDAYIIWFDYLMRQPNPDRVAMFRVLQAALDVAPNELALFQRVMTVLEYGGESADQIRERLTKLLARGESTPLLHLILGNDAGAQGDYDLAVRHLDIAVKLDPAMLVAANNLAWYLAHKESPDLDSAFSLIDTVARRWPDNAYVLDTRGQILARQGKYEDALLDLKAALPGLPDYHPIHLTLARVYRELGMKDLAAEHENRAREIADVESANGEGQ